MVLLLRHKGVWTREPCCCLLYSASSRWEKSVWDEEDGTTRQWHTVNFFVFETRLQASVQPFIVGVVGCAHSWSAHVACCVCLCQVLGIEAQRCSNMASSDSEYKLHAKSWLLQIYQGIYWEYVSMLCSLFPWSAATTFGYVAFSCVRINIGSKLAAIDGNQFLLLQAWCIIRVFEKCSIAVVQILRDCWPDMMCKLIILPVKTFSSGVSINLEVSMGPDEQNFLTCVCCTSLSLMDGNTVEDIVPLLFGLCHRRWTTAPSLLILRFNRGDFLCLSSVKVIQHLQLNTFKPQVHTPERPSGESPAGHQLVWSAKEALGDCKCSKFEPELSTDDRPLVDSICSLRYLLCKFWPSSICYVQLSTDGPCSVVSFVGLYFDP